MAFDCICIDFGNDPQKLDYIKKIFPYAIVVKKISNYFERVSDYNSSSQMCYIKTKSTDWGLLSYGINALSQPDFWGVDKEGKLGKIDADYIYFKCAKV